MSSFIDSTHYDNFQEKYFRIDDILASQERVTCVIDAPVANLGFIDPGSESDHLLPGTKLELPLWMVKSLAGRQKKVASIELPKQYSNCYREILAADASVVDLHKLGPHYYRMGLQLLYFGHHESLDISRSLLQTFQSRLRKITDSSLNASEKESNFFKESLDQVERSLYDCGQKSMKQYSDWESREIEKLASSSIVLNIKKRKRFQLEDDENQ